MPRNKKQHYVPRFFLKRFSINRDEKTIGMFNLRKSKFIEEAPLKTQAYVNYFYGKDGALEKALSLLEDEASIMISKMIDDQRPPNFGSESHRTLLEFVLFLSHRTLYHAETMNDLFAKNFKMIFKDDPRVRDKLKEAKIKYRHPVASSLLMTARMIPVAADLNFKLLINQTRMPFITCDNPVVKYNQLMERQKTHGSNTGLAVKGLEIILPVDPKAVIFLYDPGVYKIGARKASVIGITKDIDVIRLNELQIVNANDNLYFNHKVDVRYVSALVAQAKKYMRRRKASVTEHPLLRPDGENSTITHLRAQDVRTNFALSCVSIQKKTRKFELGNRVVAYRKPELVAALEASNGPRGASLGKTGLDEMLFEIFPELRQHSG